MLFWSEKIFCLHKYSMLAKSGCYCRHSISYETCALRMHFRSYPSPMALSCPSKTSYTGKEHILPITTLDFLPVQVYSQKPSSYPNQQCQKTFGAETKHMWVTPNFSTGWFTRFLQWHARLVHHSTYPTLPWKAWFTGIAQIKDAARAGDDAATYLLLSSPQKTGAKAGWLPLSGVPFQGPSGKQGQLGAGHRTSYQTRDAQVRYMPAHHSNQSGRLWGQNQLSGLVCLTSKLPL